VRNLLENAARYGQVEAKGQRAGLQAGQTLVEVELRQGHHEGQPVVEVRVLDRGPGVPLLEAQRIFEPFYRLPGHAESEGGVGLGLALVRQIAQHHGGQAEVQPREGGGSCFLIRVPRQAAA
jgi:signal transduction histidine kinase